MKKVEIRVQAAVLTAIETLIIPGVELAMKSVNASSGHGIGSVVSDLDQGDFSGNIAGLRMTPSTRINSDTDLNRIDESRGNITGEGGDLLFNERNIDRQANTHHSFENRWDSFYLLRE